MKVSIEHERGDVHGKDPIRTAKLIKEIRAAQNVAHKLARESTWRELCESRATFSRQLNQLDEAITTEDREPDGLEISVKTELERALNLINQELDGRTRSGNRDPRPPTNRDMVGRSASHDDFERETEDEGDGFIDATTGRRIRVYRSNERLSRPVRPGPDREGLRLLDAGHIAFRALHGRWASEQVEAEARAMSLGSDASGGYFVPEPLSLRVIDNARAASACMQAGVGTIEMTSNTLDLSRIDSDPSFTWKAELAAAGSTQPTIGRVRLLARTVMAIIPVSGELFDDATPNLAATLDGLITRALAAELDRVMLHGGTGSPNNEPTGVINTANINTYNYGGTVASYSWVSRGVEEVRKDNHEPNAMVTHPSVYGSLDRLTDSTGQPLRPPRSFEQLSHHTTTNVRTDLGSPSASGAFIGKWNEAVLGVRKGLMIRVSRDGTAGAVNATTDYAVFIVAVGRFDFAVLRPAAFCYVSNLVLP